MQHHAVLLNSTASIEEALSLYGDTSGYEVVIFPNTTIGIDEVRALIMTASVRPESGTHRLLVVTPQSITFEAQQALLKLMEEPPATTLFLFVTSPELSLLPTLQSRFMRLSQPVAATRPEAFVEFASLPPKERLELVSKKMTQKDNEWLHQMRSGVMAELSLRNIESRETRATLAQVLMLLGGRGSANKMLLEELALTLPLVVRK